MRPIKTVTLIEILKLLRKYLGISVTRATVYAYIKKKGFPNNTGLGRPRRWRKDKVMGWIKKEIKKG